MASLTNESVIGDAGSFIRAGSVSGLASSRVREAGSGHCGESSEHPSRIRVATWNVGSLKKRDSEVIETLSRKKVDLCGVQVGWWSDTQPDSLYQGQGLPLQVLLVRE